MRCVAVGQGVTGVGIGALGGVDSIHQVVNELMTLGYYMILPGYIMLYDPILQLVATGWVFRMG